MWSKQIQVLQALASHDRVIVRSGNGVGKTYVSALAVLWFLVAYMPSKVITTAPTWLQVEKLLWSEIKNIFKTSKNPLGGILTETELKISDDWFALGLSTNEPVRFQGHHSENILVVFDEAPGVADEIYEAAQGLLTSKNAKWLLIGNPLSPVGRFYDYFTNPLWHKIHISGLDSPNITGESNDFPTLVSKRWVEERREEWGEENPFYQARVLGNFPSEGDDSLFPLSLIEQASLLDFPRTDKLFMGVDVARFGSDETVFTVYDGSQVIEIQSFLKKSTTETVGKIIEIYRKYSKFNAIGVDDTGVGGGVTDQLREQNFPVVPCNFGSKPQNEDIYDDLKTELYFSLKNLLLTKDLKLVSNEKLKAQLSSIKIEYTSRGKVKIVSKDKMRKEGIKSPDYADSLAIAYFASRENKKSILDYYTANLEPINNIQDETITQQIARLYRQG